MTLQLTIDGAEEFCKQKLYLPSMKLNWDTQKGFLDLIRFLIGNFQDKLSTIVYIVIYSSPAIANGVVYVGSFMDGCIYAIGNQP